MRKRSTSFLLVTALAIAAMALAPARNSVAASGQSVHYFLKHYPLLPAAGSNMTYHGGSVMSGTTSVYAIFWEPTGKVQSGYNTLIQRYFADVNGSGLYKNNTQYKSSSGVYPSAETLAASWVDTRAYPHSPLLDSDIQAEVAHAKSTNGWSASVHHIFFVFTQAGQDLCFDSTHTQCASNYFCAYHGDYGTSKTIYAAMPYAASFSCNPGSSPNNNDADQTINVVSHEQMEAATDPYLNAWYDSSGAEIGDKCAWIFGTLNTSGGDVTWNTHSYIVQKEWDNLRTGCRLSGP